METNRVGIFSDATKEALAVLGSVITREISFMREMLSNLFKEQQALLVNDADMVKVVVSEREQIFETMLKLKDQRAAIIHKLTTLLKAEEKEEESSLIEGEGLKRLLKYAGSDHCDLVSLADQMIALLDKIKDQISRNNYLMENKMSCTKQFMIQLSSQDDHPTYQNNGLYKKKPKKIAVALINREV